MQKNRRELATEEELLRLNKKFHRKTLLPKIFYKQLAENGFHYHKCLLILIFPDSNNTYSGKIIRQDGVVIEFDIDLDFHQNSTWKDITKEFQELYKKNRDIKPWVKEVVSYKLFHQLNKTGSI